MRRFLQIFGLITTFGMIVVILQGALVTQTGSGAGCGAEWPLCHGQLIPKDPTIATLIEYTHRLVSGLLGLMVIIHAVWSWISLRNVKETKFFAILAVVFILFQGLLGAGAVVWGQSSAIMALHFGFSLISFTSVLLLTILAFEKEITLDLTLNMSSRFRKFIYFNLTYVYIVVYTGAYVKHTDAGPACAGWPLCNGKLIPLLEGNVAIQFGHRVVAGLLFVVILASFIITLKHYRHQKKLFSSVLISFIFITIQVISGAIVVLSGFTINATLFHALMVSLLFGSVSYSALLAYRSNK